MSKLALRYKTAQQALASLGRAIESNKKLAPWVQSSGQEKAEIQDTLNDSLIQRFEYCFDITWKYLKEYVLIVLKMPLDVRTPAAVFRVLLKTEFFTDEQMHQAMKMLDDRNLTTHTYQHELAGEIVDDIPHYYDLMKNLLEKAKPE